MSESTARITITDDFLFGSLMRHEEYCKPLLEKILGIQIKKLEYLNDQETMSVEVPGSRSIRLDIYVEDDANTVYDIEIQTTWKKGLPKRTRMYQALMDIRAMGKGEEFMKLKKSFIIFISTYDPFGKKEYVYTFSRRCNEDPSIVLKDEAMVVVINLNGIQGEISEDLKNIIEYFKNGNANDEYTRALDAEVDSYNADENWRLDRMMMLEAISTHEDIGENRRIVKTIRKKMQKNQASLNEDFADDFDITMETVLQIMESIQQHPEWNDQQIAMDIIWDD